LKDLAAARKYARALFTQALSKNELRAAHQGLEETVRIARLRASVLRGLAHPFIPVAQKQAVIHSVLGALTTPLLERFLDMLVKRRRIELLFAIAQEFQALVDRHEGIEPVRVRSAYELTAAQLKELERVLGKRMSASVRMSVELDPTLIGGLVVQTRDHVIDQSLKGQLSLLAHQISQ